MLTDLQEIQKTLQEILIDHSPALRASKETDTVFEVSGTKEVMQGRQKVNGHYFASVMVKPKDIRLYFFPIYTHVDSYNISPELKKCLKGKSCFHIKKLSDEMVQEIKEMVDTGVKLYQKDDLI